jgi:chromosome segregation ATPase
MTNELSEERGEEMPTARRSDYRSDSEVVTSLLGALKEYPRREGHNHPESRRGEYIGNLENQLRDVREEMDRDRQRITELLEEVTDLLERKDELDSAIERVEELIKQFYT